MPLSKNQPKFKLKLKELPGGSFCPLAANERFGIAAWTPVEMADLAHAIDELYSVMKQRQAKFGFNPEIKEAQ